MKVAKNALNETIAFNTPHEVFIQSDYTVIMWQQLISIHLSGRPRTPHMGACCLLPVKKNRTRYLVTEVYLSHT